MYHYFSSKEELVSQWVEHIGQFYIDRVESSVADLPVRNRGRELVRMMFTRFHHPIYSVVIDEVSVLANRDQDVRRWLAKFYSRIESAVYGSLKSAYPDACESECRKVASVIIQLVEGSTVLESLGMDDDHACYAEGFALNLLDSLEQKPKRNAQ
jgi:AcrR family transcriptional regulator